MSSIHAFKPKQTLPADHFIEDEFGNHFAGHHLLVDLYDVAAPLLSDMPLIRRTLTEAVRAAGATLLSIDLHVFEPNGGISGVAILAESHISIHTWPERGYAAIDAFMCGKANPASAVQTLRQAFTPGNIQITEIKRGMVAKNV